MRRRPGGRGTAARASQRTWWSAAREEPAAGGHLGHLHALGPAQRLDEGGGRRARHLRQRRVGREAQELPACPLGVGHPLGVAQDRRPHDLVVRQARLQEHAAGGPGPGGPDRAATRAARATRAKACSAAR